MALARLLPALLISICLACPAFGAPSIEVAFSPGNATAAVVKVIGESKGSIRLAAYSFTSAPIAQALVKAHKPGVDVQPVLDSSNATAKYSSATFLANSGIPTRTNDRYAIMHNKFIVVDGVTVQTGSFNYTKAAQDRNAENVMIVHEHPAVAAEYSKRWNVLWADGKAYPARR